MKKLALILMVGFICTTMIAQTSNEVVKEDLAATQIIDQVFDRTTEAVQQISAALKVPAEHVYTVLVKQQVIKSVSTLVGIILSLFICFLAIYIPLKDWENKNIEYNKQSNRGEYYQHYDLDDEWWLFSIVPAVCLAIIIIIILVCSVSSIITGFVNPEYGAIQDILSIL